MVVVVANPILEVRGEPGGLDAPDQPFGDQNAEGVVHRLERNGTDLGPDDRGHVVGGDVRLSGDRPENRQSLGRDLNATLTKGIGGVGRHGIRLSL
jgi:hypothetical protein